MAAQCWPGLFWICCCRLCPWQQRKKWLQNPAIVSSWMISRLWSPHIILLSVRVLLMTARCVTHFCARKELDRIFRNVSLPRSLCCCFISYSCCFISYRTCLDTYAQLTVSGDMQGIGGKHTWDLEVSVHACYCKLYMKQSWCLSWLTAGFW